MSCSKRASSALTADSTCPRPSCPRSRSSDAGWMEIRSEPGLPGRARGSYRRRTWGARPPTWPRSVSESKRVYLKREDLRHTGAHKINNALGQALIARRLGKERIVAETGAGQHGVAAATVCARFGLDCVVYMGAEDMERQRPNVERMHLLRRGCAPSSSAPARSRKPRARRSATGLPTSRRPIT